MTLKLQQKLSLTRSVELSVNEDRELHFKTTSPFNKTSFVVSIDSLTPRPTEFKRVKILAIATFLASIVVFVVGMYFMLTTSDAEGLGKASLIAILFSGPIALASAFKVKGSYLNVLAFNDRRTMDALFTISPSAPSRKAVEDFVNALEARIKSIEYGSGYSRDGMLTIYARHLDYLLSEEVITSAEYENILDRTKNKKECNVVNLVK